MLFCRGKMRWSEKKTATFCFQLSYLLDSGLPLLESMNLLLSQCRGTEKKHWFHVKQRLEEGGSFSYALQSEKADSYLVTLIQAGEYNGQYAQCLSFAAQYYENRIQWKQKVFQFVSYPLFLLLVSIVVFSVFMKLLLPQILDMYMTMDLPVPQYSQWLVQHNPLWFCVPFIFLLFCIYLLRSRFYRLEKFLLKIPFISRWICLHYSYHFSMQWGMLLDSGVNILQICSLFTQTPPWPSFKGRALFLQEGLQQGNTLSGLLEKSNCFTAEMIHFVRLGEEGGQLGKCLLAASQMAEMELKKKMEILLRWLEPGLLLLIGGMVFFAIIIFFLPMLNLLEAIQ
jgi:type II secretory pathway component PulF